MKILVVCGSGYGGSIIAPGLPGKNHEIIVIDNDMYNEQSSFNCGYIYYGV